MNSKPSGQSHYNASDFSDEPDFSIVYHVDITSIGATQLVWFNASWQRLKVTARKFCIHFVNYSNYMC